MVGLIPLFAVQTLEPELLDRLPGFKRRLLWFLDNRPDLTQNVACMRRRGHEERRLLSMGTTGRASAPAISPAGPDSSRNCCSRTGNEPALTRHSP